MSPEDRTALEARWLARSMRWAREQFIASGRKNPFFLCCDAAFMATPLFDQEPWFMRPTKERSVGAVVRYAPGTKDKWLYVRGMDPRIRRAATLQLMEMRRFVDNIGEMFGGIGATDREKAEILGRFQKWITHDDTADDTPDLVSWKATIKARSDGGHIPD